MKTLAALGIFCSLATAKISYDGFKIFRIENPGDMEEFEQSLSNLKSILLSKDPHNEAFDVAVPPDQLQAARQLGIDLTTLIDDLGALRKRLREYSLISHPYRTLTPTIHMMSTFNFSSTSKPRSQTTHTFSLGPSVEGRELPGIHLWGEAGKGLKPAIVWHGTAHAREWISAPTVEYITYKLIEAYQAGDSAIINVLDKYDFYILPIVNPDGFVYTHESERLWRKNRQIRNNQTCIGTDVNRNWPSHWNVPGAPGDTPEIQALVAHILDLANGPGIKAYIDWHSYGKKILLPYGYNCTAYPDNYERQLSVGNGVASAIAGVNGLEFSVGPTCTDLYQTAGSSTDWAFDVAGAEFSWLVELRPTAAEGGFVIPPENILPSGAEHWAGIKYMFSQL
uniref:Peptidase M14 domain-containing protein n=1 Tax=Bionectria ochroleuca TaxID=29856 RepID=A0A8H7TQW8_BIOOC